MIIDMMIRDREIVIASCTAHGEFQFFKSSLAGLALSLTTQINKGFYT